MSTFKGYSKSSGYKATKKDIAEKMKAKKEAFKDKVHGSVSPKDRKTYGETYMGRPIEELKREAGIGKYKGRYN